MANSDFDGPVTSYGITAYTEFPLTRIIFLTRRNGRGWFSRGSGGFSHEGCIGRARGIR
jgi:hypothetical protein